MNIGDKSMKIDKVGQNIIKDVLILKEKSLILIMRVLWYVSENLNFNKYEFKKYELTCTYFKRWWYK